MDVRLGSGSTGHYNVGQAYDEAQIGKDEIENVAFAVSRMGGRLL